MPPTPLCRKVTVTPLFLIAGLRRSHRRTLGHEGERGAAFTLPGRALPIGRSLTLICSPKPSETCFLTQETRHWAGPFCAQVAATPCLWGNGKGQAQHQARGPPHVSGQDSLAGAACLTRHSQSGWNCLLWPPVGLERTGTIKAFSSLHVVQRVPGQKYQPCFLL